MANNKPPSEDWNCHIRVRTLTPRPLRCAVWVSQHVSCIDCCTCFGTMVRTFCIQCYCSMFDLDMDIRCRNINEDLTVCYVLALETCVFLFISGRLYTWKNAEWRLDQILCTSSVHTLAPICTPLSQPKASAQIPKDSATDSLSAELTSRCQPDFDAKERIMQLADLNGDGRIQHEEIVAILAASHAYKREQVRSHRLCMQLVDFCSVYVHACNHSLAINLMNKDVPWTQFKDNFVEFVLSSSSKLYLCSHQDSNWKQ